MNAISKTAFQLIKRKPTEYPEENCHLAGDQLVKNCALKLAPSLLTLTRQFKNSRLKKATDTPNALIAEL